MKIFLCIPCMDTVNTQFLMSLLQIHSKHEIRYGITACTMIQDARNILAQNALTYGYDRIMWLDSDMVVDPDIVDRLSDDLDEGRDFVTGLYFTRREEQKPVIFEKLWFEEAENGLATPHADFKMQYEQDSIFRVAGCGFGACMMRTDVLKKVIDEYGQPFALIPGFGEDISFCTRCGELGIKIYCDSGIKCGHIGTKVFTENDYK